MQTLSEEYIYKLKVLIFGPKGTPSSPSQRQKHTRLHLPQPPAPLLPLPQRRPQLPSQETRVPPPQQNLRVPPAHVVGGHPRHQQQVHQERSLQSSGRLRLRLQGRCKRIHTQKGLSELKNVILPHVDFKNIVSQPVYIILNDHGKERRNKVVDDFSEMLPNNKERIFLSQFNFHNPVEVQ